MSIKVMYRVWEHAPVDGSELLLLLALADYSDDDGWCWPTIPALAKKVRLNERQVKYKLAALIHLGLMETLPGKGRRSTRRVRVEELCPPA